jgi:hypothetical protein
VNFWDPIYTLDMTPEVSKAIYNFQILQSTTFVQWTKLAINFLVSVITQISAALTFPGGLGHDF